MSSRIEALLRCIGAGLCEKGRRAMTGDTPYGEVVVEIARATLDHARRELPTDDLRQALAETSAADAAEFADALAATLAGVLRIQVGLYKDIVEAYLGSVPTAIRQVLRRPSDPAGVTAPDKLTFYKPEDLLLFLPARPPRFHPAGEPANLDEWELTELTGLGEATEVWAGFDDAKPDESPAALKFVTDPAAAEAVLAHQELFLKAFELSDQAGIVPLRSVYLESDPPCLESMYVPGYDLAALMRDWKWRLDSPKPEAAMKLIRRTAEIVGKAHAKGVVHRDLKPTNVLLYPTEGGRFSVWVTDFGWGQIQAARAADPGRNLRLPRGEQLRLTLRGAHTGTYLSPQVHRKEEPNPRDDVYALGVIWYQILKRDPGATPPVGMEWLSEFVQAGLTGSQANLLADCLNPRADARPADANEMADRISKASVFAHAPAVAEGSKLIGIHSQSGEYRPPQQAGRFLTAPVPTAAKYVARDADEAGTGYGGLPKLVYNSLGMAFVLIPPGEFLMGSTTGEPGHREHEGPQRTVKITKPFYLSSLPVTQGQYELVIGTNPSQFSKTHCGGPDHPVESLAWADAERFCEKLSLWTDEIAAKRTYRLPTEAEWEYACRAGTTSAFSFGDKLTAKEAHFAAPGAFARSGGQGRTNPVGKFPGNAFGLHDMHGNVLEWVRDWYDAFYYHDAPAADPKGPAKGKLKVVRGGCWSMFANDCRSAARRGQDPETPSNTIGFRAAFSVG